MGALFKDHAHVLGATAAEMSEKRRKGLATAGGVVTTVGGVAALLPFPPFAQIIGAGVAGIGAGIGIAAKLRTRGSLALAGDETAVAGFAKRAARWSSKKRVRIAEKLTVKLKKQRAKLKTQKRPSVPLRKRIAIEGMKLGILAGFEANARKASNLPLVADDAKTVPDEVEMDPTADVDLPGDDADGAVPMWAWGLGGLLVLGGAVVLLRRPKPQQRAA